MVLAPVKDYWGWVYLKKKGFPPDLAICLLSVLSKVSKLTEAFKRSVEQSQTLENTLS